MKKLLIINNFNFHYEIIESIIIKYCDILMIEPCITIEIYLVIKSNIIFKNYIINKYPNIQFKNIDDYDYCINCTIYDKYFKILDKIESNKKYISHEITERLKKNPNVYFLTPLAESKFISADILPFKDNKMKFHIPIYIIQGNINTRRRYYDLLIKILDGTYKYKFIIKIIGKGELPQQLEKYKDKIILKNNLNFIDYHKEFLDGYCILPLISKKTHPQYYTTKLTSTINYAKGYNLKCLIDKKLQDIYNLSNVEIYNDINDISIYFKKTLYEFYK